MRNQETLILTLSANTLTGNMTTPQRTIRRYGSLRTHAKSRLPLANEAMANRQLQFFDNVGNKMKTWSVDEIIRVRAASGGWRVWRVVGIFLGGESQEDVVELETLDRDKNTQGRMCVPCELLNASIGAEVTH